MGSARQVLAQVNSDLRLGSKKFYFVLLSSRVEKFETQFWARRVIITFMAVVNFFFLLVAFACH